MAAPLYTEVTAAIRAMLDDQGVSGGATYTNTFLEQTVETAQQTLVNTLIGQSVTRMMFRTEAPIYVPALTTMLTTPDDPTPTSPCLLPANIVTPDQLWEAKLSGNYISDINDFTIPATNDGPYWTTYYVTGGESKMVSTPAISDPVGGTNASQWDFSGDEEATPALATLRRCFRRSSSLVSIGQYKRIVIWLRSNTGSAGTAIVRSGMTGVADQSIDIPTVWTRFELTFGPKTDDLEVYHDLDIDFSTTGDFGGCLSVQLYSLELGTIEGSNPDFIPMTGPGELPRIPMGDSLRYWNWHSGRLWLLGATTARLLRMTYWATLGPINTNAKILIVNAGNAIVCLACAALARARGQYTAADRFAMFLPNGTLGGQAGYEVQNIINAEIKTSQSEPNRRLPYFGRDRYSVDDYWIRRRN